MAMTQGCLANNEGGLVEGMEEGEAVIQSDDGWHEAAQQV